MTQASSDTPEPPRFVIKGQYIKDISFENPHSPHSFMQNEKKPVIDIAVDFKLQKFEEGHTEVLMHISARAKSQNSTLFLLELDYGGLVQLINIAEEKVEEVLLVDCAQVLFPFARRIIADITRDGGFPPLLVEPVDFYLLYQQKKQAGN